MAPYKSPPPHYADATDRLDDFNHLPGAERAKMNPLAKMLMWGTALALPFWVAGFFAGRCAGWW